LIRDNVIIPVLLPKPCLIFPSVPSAASEPTGCKNINRNDNRRPIFLPQVRNGTGNRVSAFNGTNGIHMRNVKKRTLKATFTIKTCLSELEAIQANYKKAHKGYRDQFRSTMQMTQRMIVRLQQNGKLQARFVRAVLKERRENGDRTSDRKVNLSLEVVAKATGAISREARQIAWKRARVLDYFREIGVEVAKTAQTIKKKGGVEKILAEATRKKEQAGLDPDGGCLESSDKAEGIRTSRSTNDQDISVPVWMKMSDRDEIADLSIGTRYILNALRVGQPGGDLKIVSVRVASGDDADSTD
jgi:hypothetical protein